MANYLRLYRKKAGLTQKALARLIGSVYSSVSNWEIEERNPTPVKVLALCSVLKCSPEELGFDVVIPDALKTTFNMNTAPQPRAPAGVIPLVVMMGKDGLTITAPDEYALEIQYKPVDTIKCPK